MVKQEGLMRQIKKLQKQVEREQKGPITETFAERKFTFYQVQLAKFFFKIGFGLKVSFPVQLDQ